MTTGAGIAFGQHGAEMATRGLDPGRLEKAVQRQHPGREYNVRPRLVWRHANNFRADTAELDAWVGFKPNAPVEVGVARFVEW